MRVLLAEDDADIREMLEVALFDHDVVPTADGAQALTALDHQNVDAAVLDVMMPHVDGFTVCRAIRKHDRLRDIPIVMLTAKVSEDDHIKGFESGADAYLTKPIDPQRLSDVLEELRATPLQRRIDERAERLRQARFLRGIEHRF